VANVRISEPADADLAEILATSLERWGEDGRARYKSLLAAAMRELGADPEQLMSRDRRELAPRLRSFHVRHMGRAYGVKAPVHVIYYRTARSSIEIMRVLHERMEPGDPFASPTQQTHPRRRT
jgi:toxin ParE1/3/4